MSGTTDASASGSATDTEFKISSFENLGDERDDRRKNLVFLARTAEAAERYDDMCKCMRELVVLCTQDQKNQGDAFVKQDLTVDERNLLSVAYKNVIGARRASWRTLNAESQDEKNFNLIKAYKKQVEGELNAICKDVLEILSTQLIDEKTIDNIKQAKDQRAKDADPSDKSKVDPEASPEGEAQVFYLKMSGDYYRYLAEAISGEENEKESADYYKQAFELAECVLEPTHPIRLGLALNYSVCFYEILKDKKKACELAKDAFDDAISKLDKLEEADYKDSTLIMQLLRDNLTLWTSTDTEDQEEGGD